ncbi:uncharacterized protein LOC121258849 [Juglans microcarpa x Juglans regia]|uniref:uncharacterized protein LOC121258849 n=1 Tax=Juglans microcarpa x Juglans regia TaxID=2249226 RepID=UPI001B7DA33E|nr:uncharacterized protein LOC121258849 [Juglans microcarpa x Juglans regia]
MNTPRVVKTFIWKALNDSLPTRVNLMKRKIIEDARCPICEGEEESICHILWSCAAASDVWAGLLSPIQKWSCNEDDILKMWVKLTQNLQQEDLEVVATIMRRVVVKQARDSLEEFRGIQSNSEGPEIMVRRDRSMVRWKPPIGSSIKVNWDAAFESKNQKMGGGVMIRDSKGEILASLCMNKHYVSHPLIAETLALWRAMSLCAELNISSVLLFFLKGML